MEEKDLYSENCEAMKKENVEKLLPHAGRPWIPACFPGPESKWGGGWGGGGKVSPENSCPHMSFVAKMYFTLKLYSKNGVGWYENHKT